MLDTLYETTLTLIAEDYRRLWEQAQEQGGDIKYFIAQSRPYISKDGMEITLQWINYTEDYWANNPTGVKFVRDFIANIPHNLLRCNGEVFGTEMSYRNGVSKSCNISAKIVIDKSLTFLQEVYEEHNKVVREDDADS